MALVKNEHRYTVDGWMINDLKLQGIELQVYAIIYGFSQGEQGVFFGSTSYIAEFIGTTRQRAARTLDALCEKGYIKKQERKGKSNYCSVNSKMIDEMRNNNNSDLLHSITAPVTQHNNQPVTQRNNTCYTSLHEIESNSKSMNKENNNTSGQAAKKKKREAANIPNYDELHERFQNRKVAETLVNWFEYKQERGDKPYTPIGMKSFLTTVERYIRNKGERGVCQCIELTMGSNYQGILWDKCEDTR